MDYWVYILIFIFSILIVTRNLFLLIRKLFSVEPISYTLHRYELLLLGMAISYVVTYLIY